ncbi:hypothetical protein CLU79DRAFT_394202 [Phycomyces nitens]|nr:hypothetical protein CLU79DRAFT_394202 [Phycomyces nitens]
MNPYLPTHRPHQANINEWRKRITVAKPLEESAKPETSDSCGTKEGGCCGGSGGGGCDSPETGIDMNQYLCYSCQVDLKDYKEAAIEALPPYVTQIIDEKEKQERLRGQIEEFLLSDDED